MATQKYSKQALIDEIEAKKVSAFEEFQRGALREQDEFEEWKRSAVMNYAELVEATQYDDHGDGWNHVDNRRGYGGDDTHGTKLYPPARAYVRFNPEKYDKAIKRLQLVSGDEIALKDDELSMLFSLL